MGIVQRKITEHTLRTGRPSDHSRPLVCHATMGGVTPVAGYLA